MKLNKIKLKISLMAAIFMNITNVIASEYYVVLDAKSENISVIKNEVVEPEPPSNDNFVKKIEIEVSGVGTMLRDTTMYLNGNIEYIPTEFNNNIAGDKISTTVDGSLTISSTSSYPSPAYTPKNMFKGNTSSWYDTGAKQTLTLEFLEPQDISKIITKSQGLVHTQYSTNAYCNGVIVRVYNKIGELMNGQLSIPQSICSNLSYTIDIKSATAY